MAISLSTTLSPYMARKPPRVIITGKFVLGVIRIPNGLSNFYRVNFRLFLPGLATASDGTEFSLRVTRSGFDPSLPDYFKSGLRQITADPTDYGLTYPDVYSSSRDGLDIPGSVRMVPTTRGREFYTYGSAAAVENDSTFSSDVGEVIHDDMRIIIDGTLKDLAPSVIASGCVRDPNDASRITETFNDKIYVASSDEKKYKFPEYGWGIGWRPYEIRIIGQPGLRGKVSSPSPHCKLVWDL